MRDKSDFSKIELCLSPEGFFEEQVREGLSQRKIKTYPVVEDYLVKLLHHYLDTRNLFEPEYNESGERQPQTLAELYLMAQNAEPIVRLEMLRKLGDRSLYISGFFGDSLSRKIVDVDYYAQMGGAAYASLAHVTREDRLAKVFKTFSQQFLEFVDVLKYISHRSFVQTDQNILRLYERYLRTGSDLDREKLQEMGVLAVAAGQVKLGKPS
jgi:hypothetical protein